MTLARLFVLAVVTALMSCGEPAYEPPSGHWRAVATLPGGELPFGIEFHADGALAATLHNGAERVVVPHVSLEGDTLTLAFPTFNNRLRLTRNDDGFAGTLTLVKRGGVLQEMPLRLAPDERHRFFAGEQDVNADFAGRWAATFVDDEGAESVAIGEFEQENGQVTGTFRTPTGDYRYLAGQVRDRTLYLSTFDGAHAFVFTGRQESDGHVQGDFWSGTEWHQSWRAHRDADARLPDPNDLSRVREPVDRIAFEFPNAAGVAVSSEDPRFRDKVLIVALAGSWCPNCHDEAAFLAPLYRRFEPRGLEVIGLMFEHLPEFADAAAQVERFRAKFDIGYELLVAGYSDKTEATETLGFLDRVIAYPTMIVVDRSGQVQRVHTGFAGPGTGAHFEEFRTEFTAFIDALLAGES